MIYQYNIILFMENKQKTNSDPKPHNFYFNGDFETIVQIFFSKIKPIEGIVKYKMVNWNKFPCTQIEAQSFGFEWSKKFQLNPLYSEFKIGIYFHLIFKTIRFELRSKNILVKLESEDVVQDKILLSDYSTKKSIQFNCEKTNYFDNLDLEMCKTMGKELSEKLETKYSSNKFIVFLNPNTKLIQIRTK